MKTFPWNTFFAMALPLLLGPMSHAGNAPTPGVVAREDVLETPDGRRIAGRIEGDAASGFRFMSAGSGSVSTLEPGLTVRLGGVAPPKVTGLPPFRIGLGFGQRVTGRLGVVNADEVQLLDAAGEGKLTFQRGGVRSLIQRPGESLVMEDGFETIDPARWTIVGEPDVVADPRVAGEAALRIPAGGASLTHRVAEPFGSGRLEVAFHDDGTVEPGQQWVVDLTFRAADGRQTVKAYLGWAEESLAVGTQGGPALAVQRLARKRGWHRLSVRFGPDTCEVSVDGDELAHGKGVEGPLFEVRLASLVVGRSAVPEGLAGHFDDFRVVRFDEPVGGFEVDATQDEIRLTSGDQLFGKVKAADDVSVAVSVDDRDVSLPWSEVAGLHFRRDAVPGTPVEGLLVRVEWRSGPGNDPRDLSRLDGALTSLTPTALILATPYSGDVTLPRERVTAISVLGRGRRIVLDPKAHHLGDEVSTKPPLLDPPQPEGGTLERTFALTDLPEGPAFLVLDVVGVAGEANDLEFSPKIVKGQLKTHVKLNGEPFDYLNRYITDRNESPARVRIPVPRGLLRVGKNVLRFEQTGTEEDPNQLDDLGLLGIALEFPAGPDGTKPR